MLACFFKRLTRDSEMRIVMRFEAFMSDILTPLSDTGWDHSEYTIFPPTMVATTFPVRGHPSKGMLAAPAA